MAKLNYPWAFKGELKPNLNPSRRVLQVAKSRWAQGFAQRWRWAASAGLVWLSETRAFFELPHKAHPGRSASCFSLDKSYMVWNLKTEVERLVETPRAILAVALCVAAECIETVANVTNKTQRWFITRQHAGKCFHPNKYAEFTISAKILQNSWIPPCY